MLLPGTNFENHGNSMTQKNEVTLGTWVRPEGTLFGGRWILL